eukprot:symbB.v1.2.018046.t1/scaffold1425.1/size119490/4
MAQHLLDAVPRHVRFNGAGTRNLLLRNISKGELPLRINSPAAPFFLQIGSEHVGESINLAPGATLAFRIGADVQEITEVICQFFTVHIECSPPLLIDLVIADSAVDAAAVQRVVETEAAKATVKAPPEVPEPVAEAAPAGPVPVPAALAEFLGEEPSAAALRGAARPWATVADAESPPETPESGVKGRGSLDFDDRPPTPTPEDANQMDVARPLAPPVEIPRRPVEIPSEAQAPFVQMPSHAMEPVTSPTEVFVSDGDARSGEGVEMPHAASFEHVSSKLSPAEATRIAALRAKGLLKPDAPISTMPPESVPPPKPSGFEDRDLFYIEGTGWCDIYGRTVESLAGSPKSGKSNKSSSTSPTRSERPLRAAPVAPAPSPPRSSAAQQAAWDAIPGI